MMQKKRNIKCIRCGYDLNYSAKDIAAHYHLGYDCYTVTCKECGCVNVLWYREQKSLDVNSDKRFYEYPHINRK